MTNVQLLRALLKQRLSADDKDILGLFERTIVEYEEELSRTREEKDRQRRLPDAVLQPQLRLHRVDYQQLLGTEEEVPSLQQDQTSSLDQEDPEPPHIKEEQQDQTSSPDQEDPEPPHIKEEQQDQTSSLDQEDPEPPHIKEEQQDQTFSLDQEDPEPQHIKEEQQDQTFSLDQEDQNPLQIKEEPQEFWIIQGGEQLQGLEEADIKFSFTHVPVKSEDEDEAQSSAAASSSTEYMESKSEEDCGGSGSAWNSDPDSRTSESSKSDTEVSDDCQETRNPQSALRTNGRYATHIDDNVDSQPAPQPPVPLTGSHVCMARQHQLKLHRGTGSTTAEHCCVRLCRASSKHNSVISFHSVPADAEMRRKWTAAIRRERSAVTNRSRVCSRHFTKEDFRDTAGRRLLKKGVVPSLFEWNSFSLQPQRRKRSAADLEDSREEDAISPASDHDYAALPDPAVVDLALEENKSLREELKRLRKEISLSRRNGIHNFAHSD